MCSQGEQAPGKWLAPSAESQTLEGQGTMAQSSNSSSTPYLPLFSVTPTPAYRVNGFVNKIPATLLLDTGAAVTLLQGAMWQRIRTELKPWSGTKLIEPDGTAIAVQGTTTVTIMVGEGSFMADVVVVDGLIAEVLLGLDFLEQHNCTIQAGERLLTLNNGKIVISLSGSDTVGKSPRMVVNLLQSVHIPPQSEIEVMAAGCGDVSSGVWIVEPTTNGKLPVLVARAVATPRNGCIPVRLLNLSSTSTKVSKGTTVGIIQAANEADIEVISNIRTQDSSPQVTSTPKELRDALWSAVEANKDLKESEKEQLYHLLLAYKDTFAHNQADLGRTDRVQHEVRTDDAYPIRQRVRRTAPAQREETRKLIEEMLHKDIIQPSSSPWASPVVLVRKKDGSARFCVDYRRVNSVTKKDAYPLPRVDDTLDTLAGSQVFTTLDLISGYWQVEVKPEDREKTAFCTSEGLFEFKVMPFGLCNAPATFQRLMDAVLMGLQWSRCLVYLDDVVVPGKSFEDHLQNLKYVLDRFRSAGLKLNLSKCKFGRREVTFLGHVVTAQGVAADPAKLSKVASWPQPQSQRDVQQFLGFASYYRRFIKDFAVIARPLHHLTEKTAIFNWTEESEASFQKLRLKLVSPPVLAFPDHSRSFILDTDASNTGIGCVLSQTKQDGSERVIAYGSRLLSKPERNYCVTRRELLAVVYFTQQLRPYLLGKHFTLRSDHGSLTWLRNFKEPEGQLARWLEKLEEYDFTIIHRPGLKHSNADALSRLPCQQCGRPNHSSIEDTEETVEADAVAHCFPGTSDEEMRKLQLDDPVIGPVLRHLQDGQQPDGNTCRSQSPPTRRLLEQWQRLELRNGVLGRRFVNQDDSEWFQLIVPHSLRNQILEELHGGVAGGHFGEEKTMGRLQARFYWPGQWADVRNWCRTCPMCVTRKTPTPRQRGPLGTIRAGYPMQIVAVDILGPLPKTKGGNAYVLVASDYFTRWVEAYAIPNQEAVTVAQKLVDELFCPFSTPEQLHSDQGRQFESDLIAEVCRILKIHKTRTTPYHPQGDGLVERFNRTLLDMLATMTKEQPGDWDGHIRRVCLAYNSSIQATTGYTPFFLMFGREARLPLDLMYHSCTPETVTHSEYATRMKDSIEKAYDRVRTKFGQEQRAQKQFYDQKCHGKPYTPGDLVWLHSTVVARGKSRKLHHPWTGPWKVLKRIADTTYRLQDCRNPRKKLVVHFDRLKRCTEDTRMEQPQAAIREERHKPWKRSKPVRRVTGPNERITLLDGDDDTPPLTPEVEEVLPPDRIDAPPDPARPINDGGGAPDPVARRYPARARPPPGFYQESHI